MQSLALDVNVVSEEGQRAEMRDEDDDLLRAAEELGIDLSGVRAGDAPADDEATAESDEDADTDTDTDTDDDTDAEPEDIEISDGDADLDIGDIDIPEDDTEEAEA
jgi:DNA-directed RNA polymerase subunit beta